MAASATFTFSCPSSLLTEPILQDLTATSSTQQDKLGREVFTSDGRAFRYVKFDNGSGNVAAVAGGPAYWYPDAAGGVVTSDQTDSGTAGKGHSVAGQFLNVPTDAYCIWVQFKGNGRAKCSTTAAGKSITAIADGYFGAGTTGTDEQCGTCLEATIADGYSFPMVQLFGL